MKGRCPLSAVRYPQLGKRLRRLVAVAARAVAAVLLAVFALPAALGAQQERLAAKLDGPTREAVMRTIEEARTRGLPLDPLVNKALEGAMKHASGARIEAAVDTLLARLELSRAALAPSPSPRDIAAGADALGYGVTREALSSMRAIRPRGSVAVPLAVLTQLVASGVSVPRATRVVSDLIRRGARDEQLIALSDDVRWYVASGASAEAALDVRTRGLNAVLPPPGPGAAAASTDALGPRITGTGKKP
jgi:hypothetical protein